MCQFSDKFFSAVRVLASDGPIKKRLVLAYSENLELLSEDEIPTTIRPKFEILRRAMHSVKPTATESPILASVRKMSIVEANRCATSIVSMFSELVRVKTTGEKLRSKSRPNMTDQGQKPDHRHLN